MSIFWNHPINLIPSISQRPDTTEVAQVLESQNLGLKLNCFLLSYDLRQVTPLLWLTFFINVKMYRRCRVHCISKCSVVVYERATNSSLLKDSFIKSPIYCSRGDFTPSTITLKGWNTFKSSFQHISMINERKKVNTVLKWECHFCD